MSSPSPTLQAKNDGVVEKDAADPFQVVLDENDDPQQRSNARRWLTVLLISSTSLCATCASSMASFAEQGTMEDFHASRTVAILSISLFVEGLGWGPLLVGPLSEVYGRNIIYRVSVGLFFIFSFPVAFAPNMPVFLVFRFITGFCGSAFLSVAGGSVSDLFPSNKVGNPMAVYTLSPFFGPIVGPLVSGFINQHANWRWTFRVLIIWIFCQWVALILFVPETYAPVILKKKAARLRKTTGDDRFWASLDRTHKSLAHSIAVSCYKPFQLLLFDRMALLLDIWTALLLGILYLAFQAFPIIFQQVHGFDMQMTGLTFLGIGVGQILAFMTQPYWNRRFRKDREAYDGHPPPETRLFQGEIGAILVPIGLFWLAFTTYPSVHWIVPIIASAPFGMGMYFVYSSVFTYLVVAYRPIAASAMAANSALRSAFAAVFPLFAPAMYNRLGTVGATALLAGLTTLMLPLPFVFRRIGARLRAKSKFAI